MCFLYLLVTYDGFCPQNSTRNATQQNQPPKQTKDPCLAQQLPNSSRNRAWNGVFI